MAESLLISGAAGFLIMPPLYAQFWLIAAAIAGILLGPICVDLQSKE
jgi:hypothetical protein